jgi:3-oxoacyl-[acyl-carrier protein] reductase
MVPIDLSAPGSGSIVVQSATLKHGCPDVIIINGGGPPKATLLQSTQGGWANAIQSLLGLAVEAMREVIPSMIERHWGRVIVITSIAGKEPETDLVYSNTLRAGIHGLVKTCSNEVAANGVTVNAVLPGYTATDRMRQLNATGIEMRIPAGRLGKPEEIAGLVTFLASEIAGYITGQCIACDGGLTRSH